jgi:TRAP-type C4-dicarboxylate transport system permease small subunit
MIDSMMNFIIDLIENLNIFFINLKNFCNSKNTNCYQITFIIIILLFCLIGSFSSFLYYRNKLNEQNTNNINDNTNNINDNTKDKYKLLSFLSLAVFIICFFILFFFIWAQYWNYNKNNTEQNNTEQNNTEQNNTEQNNTKQINTDQINTDQINTDQIITEQIII